MKRVAILSFFLLAMLFLVSVYVMVSGEHAFYISTRRWDGKDHVYVFSQRIYPSISYQVIVKTFWIGNTLFIGVINIRVPDGAWLMMGPASAWISIFDEVADGPYDIVLVLYGWVRSYVVTKQGESIEITRVSAAFPAVFLSSIILLTPWINLLLCFGLFVVYRFRAQFINLGKKMLEAFYCS